MEQYGKLINDNTIRYMPNPLIIGNGITIHNPTKEQAIEDGWKLIIREEPFEPSVYHHLEQRYDETENTITIRYYEVEDDLDEILARLEATLIQKLRDTDHKFYQHEEGWMSDEDYEPLRLQREEWRNQIRAIRNCSSNEEKNNLLNSLGGENL